MQISLWDFLGICCIASFFVAVMAGFEAIAIRLNRDAEERERSERK